MTRHSASPPCGNLVDGLPHDCHSETVAKRAIVGPRTPVLLTMKHMFSNVFTNEYVPVNFRISFRYDIEASFGANNITKCLCYETIL